MSTSHNCDAVFVGCIDFRIQSAMNDFVSSQNLTGNCDRVSVAGSCKDTDFILKQLEISHRLHHIKNVYLIHHQDCGAYGLPATTSPEEEKRLHQSDMESLRQKILATISPNLHVYLYFAHLDGSVVPLENYGN